MERISIAVVSSIPTSGFEESKGEFGNLHLDNETGGHSFIGELSSFEVRSSSTRRSGVFHVGTLERRATIMLSKLAGKRFSIDNTGSNTTEFSRSNVTSKLLATSSQPG